MKHILALISPLLLFSTLTWANPALTEDWESASTHPDQRWLNLPSEKTSSRATHLPPVRVHPYSEADMLPVRSERLSPGKVENRATHTPGLASFFLIGDDALSRRWLMSRKAVLQQLNAVGLVVNVQELGALTELRNIGAGLDIVPASADELAERLGLQHYPLLITATGIEQ